MPGGAPPPMTFAPLQFAKPPDQSTSLGGQMQNLGKNLKAAGVGNLFNQPQAPVDPGAAIAGGQGPIVAGGPQGPAPLPGQAALPGSPYSPQAGPALPPGSPGAPPVQPPQPQLLQPQQQPQLPAPGPSVTDVTRNMTPPAILDWLKRMTGSGQPVIGQGQPGSVALQSSGLGMLPSANAPNPFGG